MVINQQQIPMHVAIISNGPSAKLFPQQHTFGSIIGVNKVVQQYRCNWWCFYDAKTFADIEPVGRPYLAMNHSVPQAITDLYPEAIEKFKTAARRTLIFDTEICIPDWPKDADKWCCYSGLAALGVAYHLGAKTITVFGADMAGESDCFGFMFKPRTIERWRRERELWNMLVDRISNKGVHIARVVPGNCEDK